MDGNQDFNNYNNAGPQPVYDQNQFGFGGVDQQTAGEQPYAGFNYYDQYQQPMVANPNLVNQPGNAADGWYQEENLSYTNYLPENQTDGSSQGNNLFKTKLCRHFQQKGFCNMGDKCNFAHGYEELKQSMGGTAPKFPKTEFESYAKPAFAGAPAANYKPHYTNPADSIYYKTSLCRNFQEKGFCQYGDKCKFAHGEPDLKQGPSKVGGAYNTYDEQQVHNPMFYPPQNVGAPGAFGYNPGFQYSYPQADTSGVDAFAGPGTAQVPDPTQNYGYNYTPDAKYYQGMPSQAPPSDPTGGMGGLGADQMNQYYTDMSYNQYNNGSQQ